MSFLKIYSPADVPETETSSTLQFSTGPQTSASSGSTNRLFVFVSGHQPVHNGKAHSNWYFSTKLQKCRPLQNSK